MSRWKQWTRAQWKKEVDDFPWRRKITSVHVHHCWRPNHAQWKGEATITGMWKYHTQTNGWSDIAQHITIDPHGKIWSGRDWNKAPASSTGYNGNSLSGPYMFEMVGDFDKQRDKLAGEQLETVLYVCGYMLYKFNLPLSALKFHRDMANKTCPGSAIDYKVFQQQVADYMKKMGWSSDAKTISTSSSPSFNLVSWLRDTFLR